MPATRHVFAVPVPPAKAIELIRLLVLERGWRIERSGEHEIATVMPISTKRASVVLALQPSDEGTSVQMTGWVPGAGPILKRMLQTKLEGLQQSLIYLAGLS